MQFDIKNIDLLKFITSPYVQFGAVAVLSAILVLIIYKLFLAKKALLKDLRRKNKDGFLSALESRLLKKINALNIGPMGIGGLTTALAVRIEQEKTHIAGLPLGINVSCWALRSAEFKI